MAKYVVTGATSFIGKAIVKKLSSQNNDVYTIIRPSSTNRNCFNNLVNCHPIFVDLNDITSCIPLIQNADYFLHFGWDGVGAAGRSNPEIQQNNIKCTMKCIETAAILNCKSFLFAGSQAEYGIKHELIKESSFCSPIIEYGKAKLEVQKKGAVLAQNKGLKYYHARIFSVYGAGDHPWTLVSSCIQSFLNNQEVKTSSGDQLWNFMYIDDAAQSLISLIESNAESGIYNIASKDTRPLKEFIQEIHTCCENQGTLLLGAYTPVEQPNNLIPDISKLEGAIGTLPATSFHDGLLSTISTFKAQSIKQYN